MCHAVTNVYFVRIIFCSGAFDILRFSVAVVLGLLLRKRSIRKRNIRKRISSPPLKSLNHTSYSEVLAVDFPENSHNSASTSGHV